MNKLLSYIVWPALAGLVLAGVLLLVPQLARQIPALQVYLAAPPVAAPPSSLSFSAAIKRAAPAVVSINNQEVVARTVLTFRGLVNQAIENSSLGSGVILNQDGFIITSYHVMNNPEVRYRFDQDITVTLSDRRTYDARLLMLDEANDLALLKIDADQLTHLELADNSRLQVGDIVLAIGNPRNIGQSVTFGIISALWRRDDSYVIQTDAAINPGNSGGALIDINGNFIGVNSTIVSGSGGSEGISFAVPAAKAMELLERYLASNPSGYLGVNADGITLQQGRRLFGEEVQGFLIKEVSANAPAHKAGLQVNDLITAVNGKPIEVPVLEVTGSEDMAVAYKIVSSVISGLPPGATVTLEIFRDGAFIEVPAVLGYGEPTVFLSDPVTSP
jgi:S1-C subfamily serine protease